MHRSGNKQLITYSTLLTCDSTHCSTDSVEWALRTFGSTRVDIISAPGMDAMLAGMLSDVPGDALARVHKEAEESASIRGSYQCLIMGHCHCRANVVDHDGHIEHLRRAREMVEHWGLFRWVATGLFNPGWQFERVS